MKKKKMNKAHHNKLTKKSKFIFLIKEDESKE